MMLTEPQLHPLNPSYGEKIKEENACLAASVDLNVNARLPALLLAKQRYRL